MPSGSDTEHRNIPTREQLTPLDGGRRYNTERLIFGMGFGMGFRRLVLHPRTALCMCVNLLLRMRTA